MGTPRLVRFGVFEFDMTSGELRKEGKRLGLQSQPAQILAELLSHPGSVVSREEFRRILWPEDTFVEFDTGLNVAVNKLRQTLHDSATAPRFIETIPKRGYRFLADVHSVEPADPRVQAAPSVDATRFRSVQVVWVAALALAVTVPVVAIRSDWLPWKITRSDRPSASPRSLAVLPFRPLVTETRDEALEMGLAEAVIVKLGELKQLRVPSIHAVQRFARLDADPLLAGRQLGVESVLSGSLLRVNGNVRLSARLLDVGTGTTLWSQQWDVPWTDIFTVQDTVASEVTRALAVSLGAEERTSLRKHPTNVAAYDRYLRARSLLFRRTMSDTRRAIELLEEAVRLDPGSAAAHGSLGFGYISVPLLDGATDPYVALGRAAATRALELDPTIAEAHAVLGRIRFQFDWNDDSAEPEFRRALDLDPVDPFVLHCYSLVLADQGRIGESLSLANRALAQDPASVMANRDKGVILYMARRYDDALEQFRRTLELDRYYVSLYSWLALAYERLERPGDAIEAYIAPLTFSEENRDMVAALRQAAREEGLKGFWKRRLGFLLEEPDVRMGSVAFGYLEVGDHDRALAWLERAFAARGAFIRSLQTNPRWDPLRSNPRYQDLLRRVAAGRRD
jgi:TolB-like protein/DNA-binding winged helix-turn-helix (wHTH) protein/tetratricopeptide (TPR) repeat protein